MDAWASYDQWNAAIMAVVFPELDVPEPVYLDLEDSVLEGLATRMGVEAEKVEDELALAVRRTLPDLGPAEIFSRHVARTKRWARSGRVDAPPFLALLASFCLAAERMAAGDGLSTANYFGRLRDVLGRERNDQRIETAYRRVAERLWSEHNRWLVELDGRRGLPTAFALTHRFVGLTISQALVRSHDRERFKEFFRQFGLAPGSDVPPAELALILDSWIHQRPCPVSASLERLWQRGQAKERIAQAAAVALSAWDGSLREGTGDGQSAGRGQLLLTCELGTFPRRRFAVQALLYLPQAGTPRLASVLTASQAVDIDLVPDLPGALGIGRASALHPADVLAGVLRVRDSLSGQTLERWPRRLVLFREDELSRRWVETPQVMLGDSVRVLAHESLLPRLEAVLSSIARPGWSVAEPYPGQPQDWVVLAGVEVYNHPGELVKAQGMDDLASLVPLTSSQLKVTGGFSLPGRVRGKWHTWAPPEVRAVSDAPDGFRVRITDLGRFSDEPDLVETTLAEWTDTSGVLVRSLAELELEDGDYRIDLVGSSGAQVMSSTTVLLRTADTPDRGQWTLVDPVEYLPATGAGVLGTREGAPGSGVKGLLVQDPGRIEPPRALPPTRPHWESTGRSARRESTSVVRLAMPDVESCIRTGRHREQIDTVRTDPQGRPLQAWSFGRCSTCGLVRRYPTRLRRSGFGGRQQEKTPSQGPLRHDLGNLPVATSTSEQDWSVAVDAVLHTGGGSWSHLERIALQVSATPLFVDVMARTLEVLGHIDIRRDADTLEPSAWEIAPTVLAGTSDGLFLSGFWSTGLYVTVSEEMEKHDASFITMTPPEGPDSYYVDLLSEALDQLTPFLGEQAIPVVTSAWEDVASVLPPLSQVLAALPRQSDAIAAGASLTRFQAKDNTWLPVADASAPGAYRVRRFSTVDIFRSDDDVRAGTAARSTVQLGKHLAALAAGRPACAYDEESQDFIVPLGADLPGLYGRAVVAASGRPPVPIGARRLLKYESVPPDLARHVYDLLGR